MRKLVISVFFVILSATGVVAENSKIDPPFGFSWSNTYEDINERFPKNSINYHNGLMGVYLGPEADTAFDIDLPSNTESVFIYFNRDNVLVKIQWNSKDFTDDPYGVEGKREFFRIRERLVSRLGNPDDELTVSGLRVYRNEYEFYECLSYSADCGIWVVNWGGKESRNYAELGLYGKGAAKGMLRYIVESDLLYDHYDDINERNAEKF